MESVSRLELKVSKCFDAIAASVTVMNQLYLPPLMQIDGLSQPTAAAAAGWSGDWDVGGGVYCPVNTDDWVIAAGGDTHWRQSQRFSSHLLFQPQAVCFALCCCLFNSSTWTKHSHWLSWFWNSLHLCWKKNILIFFGFVSSFLFHVSSVSFLIMKGWWKMSDGKAIDGWILDLWMMIDDEGCVIMEEWMVNAFWMNRCMFSLRGTICFTPAEPSPSHRPQNLLFSWLFVPKFLYIDLKKIKQF